MKKRKGNKKSFKNKLNRYYYNNRWKLIGKNKKWIKEMLNVENILLNNRE